MRLHKSASQSFSLPLEFLERLEIVSKELGVPKSRILKEALTKELPIWEARLLKVPEKLAEPVGAGSRS